MEPPEMTLQLGLFMIFGGITMCSAFLTLLLWMRDRDVAIMSMPLPLIALAMTLTTRGHLVPAISILAVLTLIRLRGIALKRWGDYTLACLLFRQHEWCEDHLKCGCPHHDEYIHREMAK